MIEIICVDDASPDRSAAIVERLAHKDTRIRLIRHDRNLGLAAVRNTGIAAASAPFVTAVDSDDYILPEMMKQLWDASDAGAADVVACGMAVIRDDGSLMYNVSRPSQTYANDMNQIDIINLLTPSFCNKLWRTALFTTHGIRFPEGLYFEDLATTPRLLRYANDIRVIPDPLYCYVMREGSIIRSSSPRHIIDHFKVYDLLSDFLISEGLMERYRNELIEMIGKTLNYHSHFVMGADMQTDDSQQYMRYMLMLKLAYLAHNEQLRTLEQSVIQDLLLRATSDVNIENVSGLGGLH
jgi:glycosyltransferase involved in cell wall biosynthesis